MNRLSELIAAAGTDKTKVAAHVGVVDNTVRRWAKGEQQIPDHQKLALADLFGVSVPWLMGWTDGDDGTDKPPLRRVA